MSACLKLGAEKSLALQMFHVLTDCDAILRFVGHGKKTAWTIWNSFLKLIAALLKLTRKFQISMTKPAPVLMLVSCVKIPVTYSKLPFKVYSFLALVRNLVHYN